MSTCWGFVSAEDVNQSKERYRWQWKEDFQWDAWLRIVMEPWYFPPAQECSLSQCPLSALLLWHVGAHSRSRMFREVAGLVGSDVRSVVWAPFAKSLVSWEDSNCQLHRSDRRELQGCIQTKALTLRSLNKEKEKLLSFLFFLASYKSQGKQR